MRHVGPRAYRRALLDHPDLVLSEPVPPGFPLWKPPPAPFVPDVAEPDQIRWLKYVWVATMLHHGYERETVSFLANGPPSRRPQVVRALPVAVRFFTGADRPGLSEFYEDGRRKVPQRIAPHIWCAWSAEQWRYLATKRGETVSARKPPPIQWVYGSARFSRSSTVNHFTHWDGGDSRHWSAPLKLHATEIAEQTFTLYNHAVCAHGWECRADLVRLRAQHLGLFWRYEEMQRAARRELEQLERATQDLLRTGQWVWK